MKSNALWGIVFLILIILGVGVWALVGEPVLAPSTATTTPEQTENTGPLTPAQLEARVVIDAPEAGANVPPTLTVTGKAPGPWYFEASFPIEVLSATGTVVAQGYGTALTDWMTTDDVPFSASLTVSGYSGPATLVLHRDNASGLPEHDASISIPIVIQ